MIEFKNPPQDARHKPGRDMEAIAEALRARPGEWALCFEGETHRSLAAHIRRGTYKAFPVGEFEVVGRLNENKTVDTYMRFVGGAA